MNSELKAVWEVYRPFKRHLYVSIACIVIARILETAYPFAYGYALDALVQKQGLDVFIYGCLGLLAMILAQGIVMQFKDRRELRYLDFDLKKSIDVTTSKKMLDLSVGQHHSEHSGVKGRIVAEGKSAITQLFQLVTYEISPMALETVFCAIGCFIIDWKIGTVVLCSLALMYTRSQAISKVYGPLIDEQDRQDDKTAKLARELIGSVEFIKINSKEDSAVREQGRLLETTATGWKRIWFPLNTALWTLALLPRTMKIVVMAISGVRAYLGDLSIGEVFIIWRLSETCLGRIGSISYFQRLWMSLIPKITRYVQFKQIVPDVIIMENALRIPKFYGEVEFRNVSFRYPTKPLMPDPNGKEFVAPERELAVSDVSFMLDPGRRYAIVGLSGAGKSTLKHLLLRSYDPTSGVIRLDGNPLTHLDKVHRLSRFGVVDQEVPLLDRTLRENLLWTLPEGRKVSDDEIWQACKMACVDRFKDRLEHGLDTLIGERGVKLSGGERQRVAIARAILKNPDIFVFDEATSSLDTVNEDDIVESINQISKGKTTLMIAHRFSTILSADEIIVMDAGKVVGQGTHRQLFAACQAYRRLVEPQIRKVEQFALT